MTFRLNKNPFAYVLLLFYVIRDQTINDDILPANWTFAKNVEWVASLKKQGKTIIDIGVHELGSPGPDYGMEILHIYNQIMNTTDYIELANKFLISNSDERKIIRKSWTFNDSEALRIVNKELAELIVIQQESEYISVVFILLAIENLQLDFRETLTQLGLLNHSVSVLKLSLIRKFKEIDSTLFTPEMYKFIQKFLDRIPKDKAIESFGYKVEEKPSFRYKFIY